MKGIKKVNSLLLLPALVAFLLFIGVSNVWGADYAIYGGGQDPAGNTENGQLVYETPIFDNSSGIDQMTYTYNVYYGTGTEWMIVEYSLDGVNYEAWNTKPYANNGSVTDVIPADHPARYAVRFRFRAGGANCWRTLWSLNIRRVSCTATITKRSDGDSDWANVVNSGKNTAYITCKGNDTGQHVTFKLSGGTFEYLTEEWSGSYYYIRSTGNQTHTVTWTVDDGYTIRVTDLSILTRASTKTTSKVTVGQASQASNPNDFVTRSTGTYNPALGNTGSSIPIVYESGSMTNNFIHTLTVNYTIASNYKVHFNGTGSTGGSMADQNFVYGTPQALTSNAFTRSYTVTFNANGGYCDISSAPISYTFAGWATSEGGAAVYSNGQTVNNLTSTVNGIVPLYATWSGGSFSLPTATPISSGYLFAGWYDQDENFVGNAGDSYTPTADITLKAHWKLYTSSANNSGDVSDGKIVINGPHATFTFSGATGIYYYKSDGYALASDFGQGRRDYTLTWEPTNSDCQIQVTRIAFWSKAYNAGAATPFMNNHLKAQVEFAGDDGVAVGTAALTSNEEDYAKFDKSTTFSSGVHVTCVSTANMDWDFYIKNIKIEYKIIPSTPTASDTRLKLTTNLEDKQTVAVSSLFSLSDPASDFTYTYRLKEDYANAYLVDGNFYATATGDYEVQARISSGDDHEASEWSTATIRVYHTCVFNNGTSNQDWQTTGNWLDNVTPTIYDAVHVTGNLTVDETIEAYSISIENGAVVNIASNGSLTVGEGGITGATTSNLILNTSDGTDGSVKAQTGSLRVHPSCSMPQATVKLYTTAYADFSKQIATWEYMGIPVAETLRGWSFCDYGQQFVYAWNESDGWYDSFDADITPFKGYCLTQMNNASGREFTFSGTLVAANDAHRNISLSYTTSAPAANQGLHVLANSFAAPIDVTKMETTDFGSATATIYLFNTGSEAQVADGEGKTGNSNTAGQYIAMPVATLASLVDEDATYPVVIPSMQGFYVQTAVATTLTFDYEKIVWNGTNANKPLRAPSQEMNTTDKDFLKISLSNGTSGDVVYLLGTEQYDKQYENGYDAPKMMSDDPDLPNIFAVEGNERLAIDATSDFAGTFIGVRTGNDTINTLSFSRVNSTTNWALLDTYTQQVFEIAEGGSYEFIATPHSVLLDRFRIVESEHQNQNPTGVDEIETQNKNYKFIYNGQLMILNGDALYDARGQRIR